MAGDWIPVRHDLHEDPAVLGIAAKLKLSPHEVVGRLVLVWAWADRQTLDGHADSVTPSYLDEVARRVGFAAAMVDEGWLDTPNGMNGRAVAIPRFERWISKSAKTRLLATKRKRLQRLRDDTELSRSERDETRPKDRTVVSASASAGSRRWSKTRALGMVKEHEGLKTWARWVAHLDTVVASKRPPWSTLEVQAKRFQKAGWDVADRAIDWLIDKGLATVSPKVLEVAAAGDEEHDAYVEELFGRGNG